MTPIELKDASILIEMGIESKIVAIAPALIEHINEITSQNHILKEKLVDERTERLWVDQCIKPRDIGCIDLWALLKQEARRQLEIEMPGVFK